MSYDDELNFLKKIISVIYERMTNYADTFVELRNNKINFKKKCVCDFWMIKIRILIVSC